MTRGNDERGHSANTPLQPRLIRVVRPDAQSRSQAPGIAPPTGIAKRSRPEDALSILLIDNGKPNAKELLGFAAEELRKRLPAAEVSFYSKQSASVAIDSKTADLLSARSRIAISGVGD